jgi:uncharacterized MnhB-related membrane protein
VIRFQEVMLVLTAIAGTAVVSLREPLRQTLALAFYGLVLAILFVAFGAPEVALSQAIVGAVIVPSATVLCLAKIAEYVRAHERTAARAARSVEEPP